MSFLAGGIFGGVIGLIFFAIGVCYARAVWSRIPFATANLVTGITAIQTNFGVTFFAYLFAILAAGWSFVWSIAMIGVYDRTFDCDDATGYCTTTQGTYGWLFLLFLAFFFGHQVLQVCIKTYMTCHRQFFPNTPFFAFGQIILYPNLELGSCDSVWCRWYLVGW